MTVKPHEDKYLSQTMTIEARTKAVRRFGCSCQNPRLGWRAFVGPCCNGCNTEADILNAAIAAQETPNV